ncbi:uncharacterized protein LOC119832787 [Zerene cesonia]|uniref:uncharacterized protein LOC119832787 n=1 Tax=Zerene cesonia TaxID=33412 RepID=UPI0018E56A1C|nr:uncharacterized protein LOC119832787 [Zerene cesonia]
MPDDAKKLQKGKNDPKEQRKRRGRQHQSTPVERRPEKEPEITRNPIFNAPEKPEKPAYEPPPPEFYKNLKRETDEILKITEEANSKYKKKEILSNWSKYEMPIESYEEIDEQENLGADYETLVSAPLSVGGHFQFKHEKSWDTNAGPSVFDKYFDINMKNLNTALLTIPFFERNGINQSIFTEIDVQNMNHRATKFKQKYYKDKKFTTPELQAQEKILNSLKISDDNTETDSISTEKEIDFNIGQPNDAIAAEETNKTSDKSLKLDENCMNSNSTEKKIESKPQLVCPEVPADIPLKVENASSAIYNTSDIKIIKPIDAKCIKNVVNENVKVVEEANKFDDDVDDILFDTPNEDPHDKEKPAEKVKQDTINLAPKVDNTKAPEEPAKNPVIESPEDLEKWLDDFLDG